MKLKKPFEEMTLREIIALFRSQTEEIRYPKFLDKLMKWSKEQYGKPV